MLGAMTIKTQQAHVVIAGGMESMSNAPHLVNLRKGKKFGSGQLIDVMIRDGLEDPWLKTPMGNAAELCSRDMGISRQAQDEYAAESYARARRANEQHKFDTEIVETQGVKEDEEYTGRLTTLDSLKKLKPVFDPPTHVTAGNASTINDGACALVLVSGQVCVGVLVC